MTVTGFETVRHQRAEATKRLLDWESPRTNGIEQPRWLSETDMMAALVAVKIEDALHCMSRDPARDVRRALREAEWVREHIERHRHRRLMVVVP